MFIWLLLFNNVYSFHVCYANKVGFFIHMIRRPYPSHLFKLMIMHFKKAFIYCLEIPIFSGVTRHPYMLVVHVAMQVWCFTLWRWFLKISLCKIQMQSQWLVIANLRANLKRNYQVLREYVLLIFNNCAFEPVHFQS